MKTNHYLILTCFILFLSFSSFAQKVSESRLPKDVLLSFKYKFPEAKDVSWEIYNSKYQADFVDNNQQCISLFNEAGIWLSSRFSIAKKEIPETIISYIAKNTADAYSAIDKAELQKFKSGNNVYCVHIVKGISTTMPENLYFNLAGKYLDENPEKNEQSSNTSSANQSNNVNANNVNNDPDPLNHPYDANKVPKNIYDILLSKVKKPVDIEWYYYNMIYTAVYKTADKGNNLNGSTVITKEGIWIETRLEQPVAELHPLIMDYLKANYKTYLVKSAELVSAPKDKSILIKIYDKKSKQTPPPITEIWFSPTGKFISVTEPDQDNDNEIIEKDDDFASQYDKKEVVFNQDENYYQKVNYKELPSSIHSYMSTNYKEYLIKSAKLITDEELGNVYVIAAKKDVDRYAQIVTFDLNGKFLKTENEGGSKTQTESSEHNNSKSQVNKTKTEKEKPSKYGTADEKVAVEELPESITKYTKKYFPQHTISESFLKQDDESDGTYLLIMKKAGEKKIVKLSFDTNGKLLKKEIEE